MAVGRLSGVWIQRVLMEVYPEGVIRRALLDHFATLLVSARSSRGAKGRLARRLYGGLLMLQRRGLILQENGIVRPLNTRREAKAEAPPVMGPVLERMLFKALLAEDGQGDGHTAAGLRSARWNFLSGAVEAGWTVAAAAAVLGLRSHQAVALLEGKPARPNERAEF